MKFTISTLLTALAAFALGLFLPWWSIAIASFIVAFSFGLKPAHAFFAGFLAVFTFWAIQSFVLNSANGGQLAANMATMILKSPNPSLLIMLAATLGGLVSGLAACAGAWFRRALMPVATQN